MKITSDTLPETDFRSFLYRTGDDQRMFDSLEIGGYALSIQASDTHYSAPRTRGLDPAQYSRFEVAIFQLGDFFEGPRVWVSPWKDPKLADVIVKADWEDNSNPVAGYMTVLKIQEIFSRLVTLSKEKN